MVVIHRKFLGQGLNYGEYLLQACKNFDRSGGQEADDGYEKQTCVRS